VSYSFKCICGVTISADTEKSLFAYLKRHAKDSAIHIAQGWEGHKGYGSDN
jgi:hypothetical protein